MKPILFNTEMVRAILEGRKTVTRRVIEPQPVKVIPWYNSKKIHELIVTPSGKTLKGILYHIGDILYVRETWCPQNSEEYPFVYRASVETPDAWRGQWRPSIHMPREAARIFLLVKDVRVERLKDMPVLDIAFEGFRRQRDFAAVWDSTIKPADRALYGWDANPWVWVIEFERISREEKLNADRAGKAVDPPNAC